MLGCWDVEEDAPVEHATGGSGSAGQGGRKGEFTMKPTLIWLFLIVSLVGTPWFSQAGDFTEKDRERLIRLETKVEEGQKALQRQIDTLTAATQRQIDDLRTLLLWGFGILFGGMGLLMGYVIWDRRTALEPVARKCKALEEEGDRYQRALREYAKVEPRLAEILRSLNLL